MPLKELTQEQQDEIIKQEKEVRGALAKEMEAIAPFDAQPFHGQLGDSWYRAIGFLITGYTFGDTYVKINNLFRGDTNISPNAISSYIKPFILARAMSILTRSGSIAPAKLTVFRGVGLKASALSTFLNHYAPGQVIHAKEPLSTTFKYEVAEIFAQAEISVILIISLPKGTPFRVISFEAYEAELILPNCSNLVVDEVKSVGRKHFVYMHMVSVGTLKHDQHSSWSEIWHDTWRDTWRALTGNSEVDIDRRPFARALVTLIKEYFGTELESMYGLFGKPTPITDRLKREVGEFLERGGARCVDFRSIERPKRGWTSPSPSRSRPARPSPRSAISSSKWPYLRRSGGKGEASKEPLSSRRNPGAIVIDDQNHIALLNVNGALSLADNPGLVVEPVLTLPTGHVLAKPTDDARPVKNPAMVWVSMDIARARIQNRQELSILEEAVQNLRCKPKDAFNGTFPWDVSQAEVISRLGGSNGAQLIRIGAAEYVKKTAHTDNQSDQLRDETVADAIYAAMGAPVFSTKTYRANGKIHFKLSRYEPDSIELSELHGHQSKWDDICRELGRHFVLDALLANWDVAGLSFDNIRVKDGLPYRMDNGGALRFRGMGGLKGARFGEKVTEIDSLRDRNMNPTAAEIFRFVKHSDILAQISELAEKRNAILGCTPPDLQDILRKRILWLLNDY